MGIEPTYLPSKNRGLSQSSFKRMQSETELGAVRFELTDPWLKARYSAFLLRSLGQPRGRVLSLVIWSCKESNLASSEEGRVYSPTVQPCTQLQNFKSKSHPSFLGWLL